MSSETGTQLEVCLVARSGGGDPLRVRALRAEEDAVNGRTLRVFGDGRGASIMADLQLHGYLITKVVINFPDGPQCQDFKATTEAQNEAFETIKQFLDDEEGYQTVENRPVTTQSPRRVEIIVRKREGTLEERRIVVTGVMPPGGSFSYTSVRGRVWRPYQVNLASSLEHFSSSSHYLVRIICFAEGGGLQTEDIVHLDKDSQAQAWERLNREFSNLSAIETAAVRDWKVGNGYSTYGATTQSPSHYYNRVPSAYQPRPPAVAYFRAAGDEIGIRLFREQEARRPAGSPPSLQTLVQAEQEGATKAVSTAAGSASEPDCDCGHLTCDYCWENHMIERHQANLATVH